MRNVLSVTSEMVPLIKTGGLADVAGALPGAMAPEGWHLVTLLPGYPAVLARLGKTRAVWREADCFGGPGTVLAGEVEGRALLVLDAPHLYAREGGPYLDAEGRDWPDNAMRFAALSWVGARLAGEGVDGMAFEVLHAHDWQAALAPFYLREAGGGPGTLITIHNIAFQGWTEASALASLRIPSSAFTREGVEFYGGINLLKAGLISADRISTVSPTYARELLTPEFGHGLEGVLRARKDALRGVLNGIDETVWNPATDPEIHRYKSPRGKVRNTTQLLDEFGLSRGHGPIFVVVSRLSEQKGLDLLLEALPIIAARDARLVLLGSGDPALERAWREAAARMPEVAVHIGYDEALSHRVIAGGEAIVVPSRFEPCGLTQLYGLKYGTMPVVADTGGLSDTVIDANVAALNAGVATGVKFAPGRQEALESGLNTACELFAQKEEFARIQRNGMKAEVGWGASARRYAALYDEVARLGKQGAAG